jgi:rhodanese-related sulfurtransferase
MPSELPDLEQIILVYCRSGRRSKVAAQKLFDMGYSSLFRKSDRDYGLRRFGEG